jgi:hypothetical protein
LSEGLVLELFSLSFGCYISTENERRDTVSYDIYNVYRPEFQSLKFLPEMSDEDFYDKVRYIRDAINQGDGVYAAYLRTLNTNVEWVKVDAEAYWKSWLAGKLSGVQVFEAFRVLTIQGHEGQPSPDPQPTPGPTPDPPPGPQPQPSGPVYSHPSQCFFCVRKINKIVHGGTYGYKDGKWAAESVNVLTDLAQVFDKESVFDFAFHNGKYYLSNEAGSSHKGTVYGLDNNGWVLNYTDPLWDLLMHMCVHTDGYLYISGLRFDGSSSGIIKTKDGIHYEDYVRKSDNQYRYGQCTHNGALWQAGTLGPCSHPAWGAGSRPAIFCNKDLVYHDDSRVGHGFFGRPCSFNGRLYLPGSGPQNARVFCYETKETVLEDTACESCLWVGQHGGKLHALFSNGLVNFGLNGAAKHYVSDTGAKGSWQPEGSFDCSILFSASSEDDGLYIAGGDRYFIGPARGRIYRV